jgi:hypothetical protein
VDNGLSTAYEKGRQLHRRFGENPELGKEYGL